MSELPEVGTQHAGPSEAWSAFLVTRSMPRLSEGMVTPVRLAPID